MMLSMNLLGWDMWAVLAWFILRCVSFNRTTSVNPSSCCIKASQLIIAVSPLGWHTHTRARKYTHIQHPTMTQGHPALLQTVFFSHFFYCSHGGNRFSRRASWESGEMGPHQWFVNRLCGSATRPRQHRLTSHCPAGLWICCIMLQKEE